MSGMWITWALLLLLQQGSGLFSVRAKTSSSLTYSAVSGVWSHAFFFASQAMLVVNVVTMEGFMRVFAGAYYVFWCTVGTVLAHKIALRVEKGSMQVGSQRYQT